MFKGWFEALTGSSEIRLRQPVGIFPVFIILQNTNYKLAQKGSFDY